MEVQQIRIILPLLVPLALAFLVTFSSSELNILEFLGIFFAVTGSIMLGRKLWTLIYDTWIGIYLGHNIDVRKLGDWAVVTGGTDGIGWALCRELAGRGLNVVLISRSLDRLERCAKQLEIEYGVMTKVIVVDFSQDVFMYQKTVDKELEGMDIGVLFNNVGMTYSTPEHFHMVTQSVAFVNNMININVTAVTMMTRAVLPGMLERGKGAVINVGSYVSTNGFPYFSMYSATKAFMERLTLDLDREYRSEGIVFQYQCPGYVTTKIAKIRKGNWLIPTPDQYAKKAIDSIGLQQDTAVWTPQRLISPTTKLLKFFMPQGYDEFITWVARSFWLFAKKRQMEKDPAYFSIHNEDNRLRSVMV